MKIPSAQQLKSIDKQTILKQGIASFDLMERAARAVFEAIREDILSKAPATSFTVIAGSGNNGGDGLALARMLFLSGITVQVYLYKKETSSADNLYNQQKLTELGIKMEYFDLSDQLSFDRNSVLVDALFGFGLTHALSEEWRGITEQINTCKNVISVDLPSGLRADGKTEKRNPVVRAQMVYTFQMPKIGLLLPQSADSMEQFQVLDIGLDEEAVQEVETDVYYYTLSDAKKDLKKRRKFDHKGTYGHALIVGGSFGKIGAAMMSTKSALKTGCGMVTAYIPKCGYTAFQSYFPEAMVLTDAYDDHITSFPSVNLYSATGIGVGMGKAEETVAAFVLFLKKRKDTRLILDADAINILSENPELFDLLPTNTILTPHPKELERLIGTWTNDLDKIEKAKGFCAKYHCILLIKGAHTLTLLPSGKMYFNSTGNEGMATAGSGDVLTGILTSLLAQGYAAEKAAVFGVFLHGLAGDHAKKQYGAQSMTATDIISHLSDAYFTISDSDITF